MNEENVKNEVVADTDKTEVKEKNIKNDKRNNARRARRTNNFSRQKVI